MNQNSIWLKEKEKLEFPKLQEDKIVDILIIGGGLSGFSILYELLNTKKTVCLVERNKIGEGVTSKSTAKLNYLQGIVYSKIKKEVGEESAKIYLESQIEGINLVKERVKKHNIDCELEEVTSFLIGSEKDKKNIEEEYLFLKEQNRDVKKEGNTLSIKDSYTFHPLKYLEGLKQIVKEKKIDVYENTIITKLEKTKDGYCCKVNDEIKIKAKQVILACHYPFMLLPFFLPVRTYIEKSYVMAKKTKNSKKETSITTYPNILSKRFYKDYEITLSGSHNICNKLNEKENFEKLTKNEKIEYLWSNEDIMTSDHLPFIGFIDENLLLATGYNTWGMATSQIAGVIIKDLLEKKANKYQKVFAPYRSMNLGKMKQYGLNVLSNIKSFTENKLKKEKSWYPKNLTFSIHNGKTIAKLKEDDKEYIVYTACPHVGCTLIFNEIEKTWDCPCHASRFNKEGECIKGPSAYNIKVMDSLLDQNKLAPEKDV